jgi:hypothetical protein
MPHLTYYVSGDYNAQCDQCGRGFKFSALRKRWDNAWTCSACWEPRHPQDFVRAVRDDPSVPIARPRIGLPQAGFIWTRAGAIFPWTSASSAFVWTSTR